MQASIAQERPAYVVFEQRSVEDRSQSTEGRLAYRDVDYAIITPMGSKDRFERVASEWFSSMEKQVQQGRFNPDWLRGYKESFSNWKNDREDPVSGTRLRDWPVLSPGQIKTLTDLRLRSVEDLANANEETLARIGMGSRTLQQKAKDWLAMAAGTGPLEELSRIRQENETLRKRVDDLTSVANDLRAVVSQLKPELLQESRRQAAQEPEEESGLERDLGLKL